MREVNCNYCGANSTEPVNSGPDLLLDRRGDYHLVRCQNCGLIYQNPQLNLDELAEHYPEDYRPYSKDIDAEKSRIKRLDAKYALARRCRHLLRHWSGPGTLLDVGCSTGLFLNAMRARGWIVEGVELSPYAAEYARATFALKVSLGTLEEASFPDASFDVVTLWDVLEHVTDPRKTIAEIARVLRPGGLAAFSLPNPTSIEARLFGGNWVGWDRPRHLHLFTPTVLERYLVGAGLELRAIESLGGRLGLTLLSLEFFSKAHHVSDRTWRIFSRVVYTWPLRALTWPAYRLSELLNKSTTMTAFASRLGHENS